ncbi:MAG: HAMP domain-containing histidine kinase [Anaerolineales bacterium]|nr:HAMP domain-containing histidine kinase [Anaerolineales bacterium]
MRFLPVVFFLAMLVLLLVGGIAALLYYLFSEYSGVRNMWLLVCCAPAGILFVGAGIVTSLYTRYGKPLRQIFSTIDAVSEGDFSARVPADDSPQFGDLIKRFNKMVGELERADKQRRDLTADIAHELRTPLHILQGNLEAMLDGVYQPDSAHLNDALEETRLLGRLVDDLQTLSMAESGQLPLTPTRFAVADLVRDVADGFLAQAAVAGIAVRLDLEEATAQVHADYQRLSQVLANLMTNALRHTPQGGSVTLRTQAAAERPGRLQILIADTGSGIPAEDLPFVFDRFWRGEKSRTRDGQSSSGLGLAISRQLVQAHGGTIDVQSELGQGTTFLIELPVSSAE